MLMFAAILAGKWRIALAVLKRPEKVFDSFRLGYQVYDCFKQDTDYHNHIAGC